MASAREGVQLLMGRFLMGASTVSAAVEESFESAGLHDLAAALASCLLTRQAEARLGSSSGAPDARSLFS